MRPLPSGHTSSLANTSVIPLQPLVEELLPPPDPVETCARLAGMPYRVFLDSAADPVRLGRYSFLAADPAVVVRSKGTQAERLTLPDGTPEPLADHALHAVRELLRPHAALLVPGLPPFQGGAAGYIGYDWGAVLERLPAPRYDDLAIPDVMLGLYDWVVAWDHAKGRAWIISTGLPETDPAPRAERAAVRARMPGNVAVRRSTASAPGASSPTTVDTRWCTVE